MPSDVRLYNRLNVFHEFHVLDKMSKDKVMRGTKNVKMLNFCFKYQQKGSDAGTPYY